MKYFDLIGSTILSVIQRSGLLTILLFETFKGLFKKPFRFKLIVKQVEFIGLSSIPIVILTGLFTGMVFSLQSFDGLNNFGAGEMTSGLVAMALIYELGPVLTGIMVAARAGSAMTAELGTMKVTEQIDALEAMAVDPVQYIVVPRVMASMISLPILNAIAITVGLIGGYIIIVEIKGVPFDVFFNNMIQYSNLENIIDSELKSLVFGVIIAIVSCHNGFNTSNGAEGVGKATTTSVVEASVLITMFDYVLTSVLIL